MKKKILAYVKDNRLFVGIISVLLVIFCLFLWLTCGAGNSMEAETSYTAISALSTSSSQKSSKALSERPAQSKTEATDTQREQVTVCQGGGDKARCVYAKSKFSGDGCYQGSWRND